MPAEATPPAQLKQWFDADRYRALADLLAAAAPKTFDHKQFLDLTLSDLEARGLMQRLRSAALAADRALSGDFRGKVERLRQIAPQIRHSFVAIFLADFVATHGLHDPEFSLAALRDFTPYGSAEFALRPFLERDLPGTLSVVRTWTEDPNEHVRRLASEGTRPRLPWGLRLRELTRDPSPTAPILDALRDDPALYVRKSVANHLNDITKDHPTYVLDRLSAWRLAEHPQRQWIAKHACRTLIKRGDPRALQLFGFGQRPQLRASLHIEPAAIQLGQRIQLEARLLSAAAAPQQLAIDYVVHYIRATGPTAQKVFKWTELELPPGAPHTLTKSQTIRDFSTRKHHPGRHRVELQINGHRLAEATFELRP